MTELDASFYVGVVLCMIGVSACLVAAGLSHWVYRKGIEEGIEREKQRALEDVTGSHRRFPANVVPIKRGGA